MENVNVKKNNTKPIVLGVIGVLVVLLIALGVIYKLRVVGNPVTLTTMALESLGEEKVNKNTPLGKIINILEEDTYEIDLTGNVTLPMDMGDVALDMNIQNDTDDSVAVMDLDVKLNGEDAIYLNGKLDRKATYFAFSKNASKFYHMTDLVYPEEATELDLDDLKDKFIASFKETVKKDDFKESEKEITINGSKVKAKEFSLPIDDALAYKLFDSFFAKIENDKELMRELADLTSMTEAEIKEEFDYLLTDLKENPDDTVVYYNLYVYKNTAVRYELTDDETSVVIDDYKNTEITIKALDDYSGDMTLTLTENKDNWTIKLVSADMNVDGTISTEAYDLKVTAEGMVITIKGTEEYKEIKRGEEIELVEKGSIAIEQDGATITIPYDFKVNVKEIENITNKNTTNSIDINNMTEAEEAEFNTIMSQIPLMSMLMGDLSADTSTDITASSYDKETLESMYKDQLTDAKEYAEYTVKAMREQYGSEEALLEAIQNFAGYNTIEEYEEAIYLEYLQSLAYEDGFVQ